MGCVRASRRARVRVTESNMKKSNRGFFSIVVAIALCGCAAPPPYKPPGGPGPFATLVMPAETVSHRIFAVGRTSFSFAIADDRGCGVYNRPERATDEITVNRYQVPLNKDILVRYGMSSGMSSCTVTASFRPTTAEEYFVGGGEVGRMCILNVTKRDVSDQASVRLETAHTDVWTGRTGCLRKQDL